MRQRYVQAQEYREKKIRAAGDPEKMPERDLGLEAMVEVLEGKRMVHHHPHRHDDIVTVLRLAREFKFRVVVEEGRARLKASRVGTSGGDTSDVTG